MDRKCEFKTVKATYSLEKGFLGTVRDCSLNITCEGIDYSILVQQNGIRIITVSTTTPVYWSKLLGPLYLLERLMMVFDGVFIPLQDIDYYDSSDGDDHDPIVKAQTVAQRLSYFKSDGKCSIHDKLIDFQDVINDNLLGRWQSLLSELDITHPIYLYSMAKTGMPVDVRLAFIIELAEPLVEIINAEKNLFPSLKPGKRETTLNQCLNALINTYGSVIFAKEIQENYDGLLSTLVSSRVRIMHIKRNRPSNKYFDGKYSAAYMMKLSLLYRRILLELLEISEALYKGRLVKTTESIDRWMEQF